MFNIQLKKLLIKNYQLTSSFLFLKALSNDKGPAPSTKKNISGKSIMTEKGKSEPPEKKPCLECTKKTAPNKIGIWIRQASLVNKPAKIIAPPRIWSIGMMVPIHEKLLSIELPAIICSNKILL